MSFREKYNKEIKQKRKADEKQAVNPFLPSWEYIPDGEPHIFENRLYLYGSHDQFGGTQFCMNDYVVWSAPLEDLSEWRYEGVIYRREQDPAAGKDSIMQAPDVCQGKDGRYYLYYTLGLIPFMSVAVCDTPAGRYEYYGQVSYEDQTPIGLKRHDLFQFDPGVFCDDDGRNWLYSGFGMKKENPYGAAEGKYIFDGAYAMELTEDMRTIKGKPKKILSKEGEHGFYEGSSMRKINGKYYFIYSSVQSHELCYAISDKPDENFVYAGTLVSIGDIGISDVPRNYLGNTHGSIVNIYGKWYVFYHRQTNRNQFSRQACAEPIEYGSDGLFRQAELTSCGLSQEPLRGYGEYEARIACNLWSKDGVFDYGVADQYDISEHPYFTQTGFDREENGDQYIANMREGATAGFKYFRLKNPKKIGVLVSGAGKGAFSVAVDSGATPFCYISIHAKNKKQWFWGECCCVSGDEALYFTYHGEGSVQFHRFELKV